MGWMKNIVKGVNSFSGRLTGANARESANEYGNTMDTGMNELRKNYEATKPVIQQGYAQARQKYQTPEMVATRGELYNRVMGKGGYSPEAVNTMKGNTIEQGGVQMRNVQNALSDRFGDSSGGGMTGENLSRALTTIGGTQAAGLRDIDVQNAKLAEEQQTGAIPMMTSDAATQAGFDTGEAGALAGLTTEQAKALAEMLSSKATGQLSAPSNQRGLLAGLV